MTIQTDRDEEWGGSNPDKMARLEAAYLCPTRCVSPQCPRFAPNFLKIAEFAVRFWRGFES